MFISYEDFEPDCQYHRGEAHDIIEFQLKGFKKEQLKVHFSNNGVLKVSGERSLDGTKRIRFRKEFNTPKDCKANEIHAKFSSGILFITIPKKIAPQVPQQEPLTPAQQAPSPIQDKGKLKQETSSQSKASSTIQDKGKLEQETSSQSKASSPIQDKGKLEQETSRQSKEAAEQSGARDVMSAPTEHAILPKAGPKSFIAWLKMERKTAVKVVASVTALSLLFSLLFYALKFYDPMIMHV